MKNRERLLKSNAYDLLCRMNMNLMKTDEEQCCIMNALLGNSILERCHQHNPEHWSFRNCKNCIAAWLNEEESNGNSNHRNR